MNKVKSPIFPNTCLRQIPSPLKITKLTKNKIYCLIFALMINIKTNSLYNKRGSLSVLPIGLKEILESRYRHLLPQTISS
jgi:glycosylphosphatidylinositol transamidase (GPIT) subunit GPI8